MGKLFVLMGVPGSGKSTWCKNHITNETYVSRDEIRFSLISENDEYFSKESIVFNTFIEKINNALNNGEDVFADATHLNRVSRNKIIKQIHAPVEEINVIWIKTPLEEALRRNSQRMGRAYVPESVIRKMFASMESPEFEEGFSKIYIVQDNQSIIIREEG